METRVAKSCSKVGLPGAKEGQTHKPNIQLKLCPYYNMHWNGEEAEIEGMADQRLSQFEPHLIEKRQSLTQLMIICCA